MNTSKTLHVGAKTPTTRVPAKKTPQDVTVEQITPEMATEYLATQGINRNVRKRHVAKMARDMNNGNWRWTGEPISFDTSGALLDGQHRLKAVIMSGTTQKFLVLRNLESAVRDVVDTGAARTMADVLRMHEVQNSAAMAAGLRLMAAWKHTANNRAAFLSTAARSTTTHSEMINEMESDMPRWAAAAARGMQVSTRGIPASAITFAYKLLEEIDHDDAEWFFDRLFDGVNLASDNPIWKLRERGLRNLNTPYYDRPPTPVIVAWIFKAWNAYRDGIPLTSISYAAGGATPERFPTPK